MNLKADVAECFKIYVDTVNTLYIRETAPAWPEEEIDEYEMNLRQLLQRIIKTF